MITYPMLLTMYTQFPHLFGEALDQFGLLQRNQPQAWVLNVNTDPGSGQHRVRPDTEIGDPGMDWSGKYGQLWTGDRRCLVCVQPLQLLM